MNEDKVIDQLMKKFVYREKIIDESVRKEAIKQMNLLNWKNPNLAIEWFDGLYSRDEVKQIFINFGFDSEIINLIFKSIQCRYEKGFSRYLMYAKYGFNPVYVYSNEDLNTYYKFHGYVECFDIFIRVLNGDIESQWRSETEFWLANCINAYKKLLDIRKNEKGTWKKYQSFADDIYCYNAR